MISPDAFHHGFADVPGLRMHYVDHGEGPAVLLCHGFPESWYSWRHQLDALAKAGFRAIAPDQRGYGQTDGPPEIEAYSQPNLVGDLVGLLDALAIEQAVVVGHDWGALVAWNAALLRPDRFRAVATASVPYIPQGDVLPTDMLKALSKDFFSYILYFQEPGPAEAELEADVRTGLRRFFYTLSGEIPRDQLLWDKNPRESNFMDQLTQPPEPMAWLAEAELDFFVGEFERRGFRNGLNWYRCIDRSWAQMRAFRGRHPEVPAGFIQGEFDYPGANDDVLALMEATLPDWRGATKIPGAGHWLQQERPDEFNASLIAFLRSL
ncbi:MAG: alpha/beta hydrolase [Myxococcota bacterium]|jgi:pimeloyl-ACP methyl ester carboxylesterase